MLSAIALNNLRKKFFEDPDWADMETLIETYIEPLRDMSSIDLTQPAEHVKAEVKGRMLAHESLKSFLEASHVVSKGRLPDFPSKPSFE